MKTGMMLFKEGEAKLKSEHAQYESTKIRTLRAGSAGCLVDPDNGQYIGSCPHEALARFMGYSLNKDLMQGYFDGGVANESIWLRNIESAVGKENVRCEEQIPIRLEVDGYPLTGRPDMVIGRENTQTGIFTPQQGFELKACMAIKSGSAKLFGFKPDDKHLCQAAIYSKALGIPWSIIYTIYASGEMDRYRKKDYNRDNLVMGKVEFPIFWENNKLSYTTPYGDRVDTIITWEGIINFYKVIVEMYTTKSVGWVEQAGYDATKTRLPWNPSDYNDFTNMVPVERGWDMFMMHLKEAAVAKRAIKKVKKSYQVFQTYADKNKYESWRTLELMEPKLLHTVDTLEEARDLVYDN